jgi:DNA-binding response OmpR family regulator
MIPRETLQELVQLRQEVAELKAELSELKNTDRQDELQLRSALGLTVGVTKMLLGMVRGGIMSREQLAHIAYGENDVDGDPRRVDSTIKRIRQRLPWVVIHTHYGYGYELDADSVARVRAAMRGQE